jgi:hypothetical protein
MTNHLFNVGYPRVSQRFGAWPRVGGVFLSMVLLCAAAHADDGRTRVIKAGKLGTVVVRLPAALQAQPAQAAPVPVVQPEASTVVNRAVAPAAPTEPLPAPAFAAEGVGPGPVYTGHLACELGQSVVLTPDASTPGRFHLQHHEQRYHLRRVPTTTGAVRLEDEQTGAVWLQLAHKSMLMSQKLGRRLVDECAGPIQQAAAENLRRNPAPYLLDVAQSPRRD